MLCIMNFLISMIIPLKRTASSFSKVSIILILVRCFRIKWMKKRNKGMKKLSSKSVK